MQILQTVILAIGLLNFVNCDFMFDSNKKPESPIDSKDLILNTTTGGPYTYSQSGHYFYGTY